MNGVLDRIALALAALFLVGWLAYEIRSAFENGNPAFVDVNQKIEEAFSFRK